MDMSCILLGFLNIQLGASTCSRCSTAGALRRLGEIKKTHVVSTPILLYYCWCIYIYNIYYYCMLGDVSPWNCEPKHATSCNKHQQTSWKGESPSIAFINGSIFSFTFSFHRYSLSQQAEPGVAFSEHPLLLLALTGLERLKHDPLRAVGSRSRCDLSVVPRASLCIGKWPWIGWEWWLPDIFQQRWTGWAFKKWFHSANEKIPTVLVHSSCAGCKPHGHGLNGHYASQTLCRTMPR